MAEYYRVYVKPKKLPYKMFRNFKEWAKAWLEDGTYIIVDNDSIIVSDKIRRRVIKSEIPNHSYGCV